MVHQQKWDIRGGVGDDVGELNRKQVYKCT